MCPPLACFVAYFVVSPLVGEVDGKPFCAVFAEGYALGKFKDSFFPIGTLGTEVCYWIQAASKVALVDVVKFFVVG